LFEDVCHLSWQSSGLRFGWRLRVSGCWPRQPRSIKNMKALSPNAGEARECKPHNIFVRQDRRAKPVSVCPAAQGTEDGDGRRAGVGFNHRLYPMGALMADYPPERCV
jgi:hypothetical protein